MENKNIYSIFLEDDVKENVNTDIGNNEIIKPSEVLTNESATNKDSSVNLDATVINFSDAVKLMKKDDELSLAEAMSGLLKAKLNDASN